MKTLSILGRGVFWNTAAGVATQGATFVTNVLAANLLGISLFGQFSYIQIAFLCAISITQGAVSVTTTRYTAELRARDKALAGEALARCHAFALALGLTATALVAACSPWLADRLHQNSSMAGAIAVGSLFVFFSVLSAFQIGALGGLQSYRTVALNALLSSTAQIVASVVLMLVAGLTGLLVGLALAGGFRFWLLRRALRRNLAKENIPLVPSSLSRARSLLTEFALPSLAIGILSSAAQWWTQNFLAQRAGFEELALFTAANNVRSIMMFLPLSMHTVALSILTHQSSAGTPQAHKQTFWLNVAFAIIFTASVATALAILAPTVLSIYGASFQNGAAALRILLAAGVVEAAYFALYQSVLSDKRMWYSLFAINTPWAIAMCLGAYFLIPERGSEGAATAYLCAHVAALSGVCIHLLLRSRSVVLRPDTNA